MAYSESLFMIAYILKLVVSSRTDKMGQIMFKMFLFHQTAETGWTNSALLQDEPDFRCSQIPALLSLLSNVKRAIC